MVSKKDFLYLKFVTNFTLFDTAVRLNLKKKVCFSSRFQSCFEKIFISSYFLLQKKYKPHYYALFKEEICSFCLIYAAVALVRKKTKNNNNRWLSGMSFCNRYGCVLLALDAVRTKNFDSKRLNERLWGCSFIMIVEFSYQRLRQVRIDRHKHVLMIWSHHAVVSYTYICNVDTYMHYTNKTGYMYIHNCASYTSVHM